MPYTEHGPGTFKEFASGQSKDITHNTPRQGKPYAQKPVRNTANLPPADHLNAAVERTLEATGAAGQHEHQLDRLLSQLPSHRECRRIAIAGNALLAANLAATLATNGEKTCVIELGYDNPKEAQIAEISGYDSPVGLSDVFKGDIGLDDIIIKARAVRPHPQCYILPQGRFRTEWQAQGNAITSLIKALSKKFHRVIISIPQRTAAADNTLINAGVRCIDPE